MIYVLKIIWDYWGAAIGTYRPQYRPLSAIRYLDANPLLTRNTLFSTLVHSQVLPGGMGRYQGRYLQRLQLPLAARLEEFLPAQRRTRPWFCSGRTTRRPDYVTTGPSA
jgi:hypothetical protein